MTDTRDQFHERDSQVAPPVRSGEITPLPWTVNTLTQHHTEIFSGNYLICEVIGGQPHLGEARNLEQDEAHAAFIVRAVNSHADMLATLKRLREKYARCAKLHGNDPETIAISVDFVDAAVAKAEGRS